ncbi:MAG: pentapeptide repeat-containing protein [Rhodocyclaceae bacterium]
MGLQAAQGSQAVSRFLKQSKRLEPGGCRLPAAATASRRRWFNCCRPGPKPASFMDETLMLMRNLFLLLMLVRASIAVADPTEPLVINGCGIWPHAQCSGVDLRHADLVGKNLAGANFTGANLARADLRGANLAGAIFDDADLTAARLNKVNAPTATFRGARMVGVDLEFARLMRADFSGADLTAANLEMARLNFAWFVGARLNNANLQESKFVTSNLKDANLEGTFRRYTIFPDSFFEGCTGCPTDL